MKSQAVQAELEAFEAAMARCGLTVPEELKAGALHTYREHLVMARLLRQPRDATSEPAQVFDLLKLVAEAEISASERRR